MLLDCLAGHSELYGFPGETKVLPFFIERQAQYGDLKDDRQFAELWRDLLAAIGGRGWREGVSQEALETWGERPRTAAEIFDFIMTARAAKDGKRIWCEKTPMYVHHLEMLATEFPTAKFIHVIRDGRDCAASFHRRWKFNPVRTVFRWKHAIREGRKQGTVLGDRYCEVHYETFTAEPQDCLREICNFIGVSFEESVLSPVRVRPQMTGSSEKTIAINSRRAEQYFSRRDLTRLEKVAGQQLKDCGYPVHYVEGDDDPPRWLLRWWEVMDDVRRTGATLRTVTEMRKSRRLSYLTRRVRGALRQKSSLR